VISEKFQNEYYRLMNEVFHDAAQAHAAIKGCSPDNLEVLVSGGRVVAGSYLVPESSGVFRIEYFLVAPSVRGQGYGARLLSKLHFERKGLVYLLTRSAKGFYERHGYVCCGSLEGKDVMAQFFSPVQGGAYE
jgi:GNAT superfamily N-acetyltransferase